MRVKKEKPLHEVEFEERIEAKLSETKPGPVVTDKIVTVTGRSWNGKTYNERTETIWENASLYFRGVFIGNRGKLFCVFYKENDIGERDSGSYDGSVHLDHIHLSAQEAIDNIPGFRSQLEAVLEEDYAAIIKNARRAIEKQARADAESAVEITSQKQGFEHYGLWS